MCPRLEIIGGHERAECVHFLKQPLFMFILLSGMIPSSRIVIYDIVPTDPDATFTLLCSQGFKAEPNDYSSAFYIVFYMRHNCIYLSYQYVAIVWDFIGGRYCNAPPSI
ncbi:hypothetical protein EST38_g3412 [Candolleomyces aberdarensis]|uniref:Uncharacterized protein n=1 Tax=Candolleomyces aberdarensis TaxID=2316362 RepID=A0A4Q2DQV1_9AGAR|nr:hypothetical protein EST38_g3412 [Candolleomyces aberdarensis]